jgi:hypothetical protein
MAAQDRVDDLIKKMKAEREMPNKAMEAIAKAKKRNTGTY